MTKEYLKMADLFEGIHYDSLVEAIQCGLMSGIDNAEYAAHAINSHDELVAEVERLRGAVDELERENENISAILLERTSALGPYI